MNSQLFNGVWEEDERQITFLKHDTITINTPYKIINKVVNQPPKVVNEPPKVVHEPPKVVKEPVVINNIKPSETFIEYESDDSYDFIEDEELNADLFDKQVYSKFMYQ